MDEIKRINGPNRSSTTHLSKETVMREDSRRILKLIEPVNGAIQSRINNYSTEGNY